METKSFYKKPIMTIIKLRNQTLLAVSQPDKSSLPTGDPDDPWPGGDPW